MDSVCLVEEIKCFHSIDEAAGNMAMAVIEDAFDRKLREDYFNEKPLALFAESEWKGVAIVKKVSGMHYLDKLAVKKEWQHNSVAADLLHAVFKKYKHIFWRTSPFNPVNFWYFKNCDGCIKCPGWNVFWKGLQEKEINSALRFALRHESDFEL